MIATSTALPNTGFAEDIGAPGLLLLAVALVAVIFLVRRLRASPNKYITQKLLSLGKSVRTITGHPNRPNPFGDKVAISPFNFDKPAELVKSLRGAVTLYNTYWVRFSYKQVTFDKAVENRRVLIRAAEEAGVRRIVHISITNASESSPFPYFRGKGVLEKATCQSSMSYAIIRPTVLFGHEDILINNIAWLLRRFPFFAILGSGTYKLQPVFVEGVAAS